MFFYISKYFLYSWIKFYFGAKLIGRENVLPKGTAFIVCANHYSAFDAVSLGVMFPGRIHPMAKAELFKKWWQRLLFGKLLGAYPVKRGEVDIKSIKMSLKFLKNNEVIGIFAEGTRNKTDKVISEPGVAMLAIKAKVPVIPVSIKGEYKAFGKVELRVGQPIYLDQYYDKKLKSDEYSKISIEIMKIIKDMAKNE